MFLNEPKRTELIYQNEFTAIGPNTTAANFGLWFTVSYFRISIWTYATVSKYGKKGESLSSFPSPMFRDFWKYHFVKDKFCDLYHFAMFIMVFYWYICFFFYQKRKNLSFRCIRTSLHLSSSKISLYFLL